jgi:hypothetical protein
MSSYHIGDFLNFTISGESIRDPITGIFTDSIDTYYFVIINTNNNIIYLKAQNINTILKIFIDYDFKHNFSQKILQYIQKNLIFNIENIENIIQGDTTELNVDQNLWDTIFKPYPDFLDEYIGCCGEIDVIKIDHISNKSSKKNSTKKSSKKKSKSSSPIFYTPKSISYSKKSKSSSPIFYTPKSRSRSSSYLSTSDLPPLSNIENISYITPSRDIVYPYQFNTDDRLVTKKMKLDLYNSILLEKGYMFIKGVSTISYIINKKDNINIILFGESHNNNYCNPKIPNNQIIDYLTIIDNLFNTNKNIDYYSEYLFSKEFHKIQSKVTKKSYITEFYKKYKDCIYPRSSKCLYNNLRIHNVDSRLYEKINDLWINALYLYNNDYDNDVITEIINTITYLNKIFKNKDSFINYINSQFNVKIKKYLSTIQKPISDFILEQYNIIKSDASTYINFYYELSSEIINNLNLLYDHKPIKWSTEYTHYINKFNNLANLLFFELYTLGRMFKIYNDKNTQKVKPTNMILQFGKNHILRIRRFLLSLPHFEEIFFTDNISNCSPIVNKIGKNIQIFPDYFILPTHS